MAPITTRFKRRSHKGRRLGAGDRIDPAGFRPMRRELLRDRLVRPNEVVDRYAVDIAVEGHEGNSRHPMRPPSAPGSSGGIDTAIVATANGNGRKLIATDRDVELARGVALLPVPPRCRLHAAELPRPADHRRHRPHLRQLVRIDIQRVAIENRQVS